MSSEAAIVDPVLLVRISRLYREGMSDAALYEATRGVWKLGPRRDRVRYVLAVFEGSVKEVYEIFHWQPAGTAAYETRTLQDVSRPGRWEFVGDVAPDEVRQRYLGRSVHQHFERGNANPVTYVNA